MDEKKIREALPPEMKDKMDNMSAKDRMEFLYTWIKSTNFLHNTLSRKGKQMYLEDSNTPIEKYNRADQSAIEWYKDKMKKWLKN